MMMTYEIFWEALALGVDMVAALLFYKACRNREKDASIVSNAVTYSVGDSLRDTLEESPGKCLPYVCIEGVTEAAGGTVKSHFTDVVGVVRHELLVEHKTKRTQGFWSDMRRVIKDVTNIHPFYIVNPESQKDSRLKVEVVDPLASEYFLDHLPITHDRFDENRDGFLHRILDRLFGEMTKGYQETEKMLGIGVPIISLGSLTLDGKRLILQPPNGGERYIVTTMSKPGVVRVLRSDIRMFKICFWICAIIGGGISGYIIYKFIRKRIAIRHNRDWIEELRSAAQGDTSGGISGNECIICVSNPREVVILNCGHICLCSECATLLPDPKLCPVCRSFVSRFIPIYIS